MLNIRDISGNILLSTPANEGCKRKFTLMREDYINIKFSLDNPIYFKIGSYVDCDFGRFEVCDVQKPSYNTGTSAYDYDLRLDAYYWKWKNKIFRYTPESSGQEAAWNLTAPLDVQASIIIRNLKALGYKYNEQDFTFSIDNTVDNKAQLMSYNNTSILDACFSMAEKWNCECWITDSVIHFGRCEFGDAIDFNIGVNVEDMTRSDSQTGYATRIYAFGSTRNIPSNYRPSDSSMLVNGVVQKRLMLPVGVPYIDAYTDMSTEEAIEQVVVFDNIYPSRVGTMTDVSSYEHSVKNDDDTTTTETFYRFTDAGINFSKDYLLDGSELRIVFQSGLLNGMDFAVKFNPNGVSEKLGNGNWNPEAQLYEIIVNEDYGRKLPDTILKPKVGDKYILHGFDSLKIGDMSYISSAEQELKTHAEKYVAKSNTDPSTYDCRMMSDTMIDGYGNAQLYEVGQRVNLLNPAYFEDGRVSRIIGFEYNLDIPFDIPIYTVGETAAYSRIKELENKVDELVYKGQAYVGGGTGVYLITSFDRTSPSDSNTFSARRALKEFLSKTRPDHTPYSLEVGEDLTVDGKATAHDVEVANQVTSLNAVIRALATIHNLTVDNTADIMHGIIRQYLSSDKFVSGFLGEGFKVWQDAAGLWHGELDMLTVRKTFTVFELVVQKVVHQGGMVIRSAAGGKITKVTDGGSYWRCEHDSTDDFVKDDQVLCQVFTGTKMKRYWRLVTSAGAGYFNLSKTDCEAGSATPEVGDEVAVLGNRTNAARQSAQVDCAVGANAPYRDDYAGINSYSLVGKLVTRTGNLSGIVDPDFGALSGFGLYSLNAYLKGMLRLVSGKTVETAIGEARSGAISAAASDAQAKANAAKAAAISAAASDAQAKAALAETNAKTHAQAILDALQIGGRNLIPGSGQLRINSGKSLGSNYIPGQQYTISIERSVNISPGTQKGALMMLYCSDVSPYPLRVYIPISESRQVATFTYPQAGKGNLALCATEAWTGTTDVTKLKIEKGAKATDWTPAPEDVEAGITFEITKVRTDFDVREGQISTKVAEVTAKTQQAVSAAETATSKANDASGAATRAAGSATAASGSASAAANEAGKAKSSADTAAAKLITVTEKESNINQTAGQIATGVAEVTRQAGIASNAANNANTALQTVSTKQTQINQVAADIDLKATRAEQAAGRAEEAEARVNIAADGVVINAAKQAAQQAVDGVQIGGRNYIILSKLAAYTPHNTTWHVNDKVVSTQKVMATFITLRVDGFMPIAGEPYTISGIMKKNGIPVTNAMWVTKTATTYATPKRFEVKDATGYFECAMVFNTANMWLIHANIQGEVGDTITIDGLKLEKGTKATDWTLSPEDADAALQIGGRNLLRNAINFHEAGWNDGFAKNGYNGSWEIDGTVKYNGKPTLKTLVGYGIAHPWLALENGVEYTYSAMVRTEVNVTGNGTNPLFYWAGYNGQNQGKISIISHDTSTVANQWKLIRIVFKLTGDADFFRPIFYRGTTGGVNYWIAWLKLEKGNKATDGTPAHEDVEADATAKADAAKQSAISDAAAKYPTKTEYSAQLAVLNSSISSKVSQTDFNALSTRMSTAEQKITPSSIISTVSSTVESAKTAAINAAASDAQAKANAAKQAAISAAAGDATAKADAAKQAAISTAANDATAKANRAEANAKAHANNTFTPITTYNTKVAQLENLISLKAESSTVSGLTTRMAVAEEKITPGAINMVVKEQITTAVNNVQVGGRNLYRKSTEIVNLANAPAIQKEADADSAHGFKLTGKQGLLCAVRMHYVIHENGDYVISFWGKSNGSGTPKFGICNNPCTGDATFTTSWKRFELRAKVNNYTAGGYHFIDIENLVWLYYWFKDFKVEKGTKATDWIPAPEDVEADIALRPTKEEVKAGISITTGGINVFGKQISLKGKVTFDSFDSSTQAAIAEKVSTATFTSLQNSLGAMAYQNMVSLAKLDTTIVQGGYIKTNLIDANAVITNSLLATKIAATDITTGRLTVIDGAKVAGFRVNGSNLTNANDTGQYINDASIIFRNDAKSCFAGIGGNVMPTSSGLRAVARFENEDTSDQWGLSANYAMIVSARGANDNCAISLLGGYISRFAEKVEVVTSSRTIDISTTCVLCINTSDITLTLPTMQKYDNGHVIEIKNLGNKSVTINTGYGYHIDGTQRRTYMHVDRGSHVTSLTIGGNGDAMRFVYARDINNGSQYGCWAQFKHPRDW